MMRLLFLFLLVGLMGGCAGSRSGSTRTPRDRGRVQAATWRGGDGSSFEEAVRIVGADTYRQAVATEHAFLSERHGEQNRNWRILSQSLVREEGRSYDLVEIEIVPGSARRYYYFDVTGIAGSGR